jgi:hypothetical protein
MNDHFTHGANCSKCGSTAAQHACLHDIRLYVLLHVLTLHANSNAAWLEGAHLTKEWQ